MTGGRKTEEKNRGGPLDSPHLAFVGQYFYTLYMFIFILLGLVTLAGVIYLAISRKSSKTIRIAALCALGLMVITIIVCLLFVFGVIKTGASEPFVLPDMDISDAPQVPGPNFLALIMLIIFVIVLFVLILVLSLREQWRKADDSPKDDW